MKNQILKAIKGLKNFTIEDLELITGFDEAEILESIKELSVKNSGNIYTFEKPEIQITKTQVRKEKLKLQKVKLQETKILKLLTFPEDELKIYNSAPEWARKKGDKYLRIIKLTRGATGKSLRDFIRYWNNQYPDIKTSFASVMRAKKKLQEEGLLSLVTKYSLHNKGKSIVTEDMYSRLKDIYLSENCPTLSSCYEKVKQEFINSDDAWRFPSYVSFRKRLKDEFTQNEINLFRKKL